VQLVAPVRETAAVRQDGYGQRGELFQYPYPIDETNFLVAYSPFGWGEQFPLALVYREPKFKIYLMSIDGRRELLAADAATSCNQPVPLVARKRPHVRPCMVDLREDTGTFYVQDVYAGWGLPGVPRGTVKRLRVVALDYRAAVVGFNRNKGPAGSAMVTTPIAIGGGSWDVKIVLGDATVHADGSACFTVPARTPVYFQALDDRGCAVQTMRSWSTLQPGERFACVGCHESKNQAPSAHAGATMALQSGPERLSPFYGPPRGFSFAKEIQPILDRHCTRCHNQRAPTSPTPRVASSVSDNPLFKSCEPAAGRADNKPAFSLLGAPVSDGEGGRLWSDAYLALTQGGCVKWISAQSEPSMLPPYHAGAATSPLLALLERGHYSVRLNREEMEKIASWIDLLVPYCGDYTEAWAGKNARYEQALEKRKRMQQLERDGIEQNQP